MTVPGAFGRGPAAGVTSAVGAGGGRIRGSCPPGRGPREGPSTRRRSSRSAAADLVEVRGPGLGRLNLHGRAEDLRRRSSSFGAHGRCSPGSRQTSASIRQCEIGRASAILRRESFSSSPARRAPPLARGRARPGRKPSSGRRSAASRRGRGPTPRLGQPGEEPELDQLGLGRVLSARAARAPRRGPGLSGVPASSATATSWRQPNPLPGRRRASVAACPGPVLDQDAAHGLGSRGEEVTPAVPVPGRRRASTSRRYASWTRAVAWSV